MSKKEPIERIVMCDKCGNRLWNMKILSYFGDHKDPVVGATEWESANPLVTSSRPTDDWDCPICKRPFVWEHKNGHRMMKMVDPKDGKWSKHWI